MTADRFVPANAELRTFDDVKVQAYCYQSGPHAALLVYKGRKRKAVLHVAYPTTDARDARLAEYVDQLTKQEAALRERRTAAHGLVAGDIVFGTWGYEQTHVTFYQVVRVPSPQSVVIRQIEADIVEDRPASMTGTTTPRPDAFAPDSKETLRRAVGTHRVGGGDRWRGDLQKWDGKPRRCTWYG